MRSLTLDVGGPVFVADFGGTGTPMILLHGLGGSHLNWTSVGPAFARTHRVFAPDLPGFGRTPTAGRTASIGANVRFVEEVVKKLAGEPAVLVGNSMGGLIALAVAAGRSDLLSGLVLVDPALPSPPGEVLRVDPVAFRFLLAYFAPRLAEYFFSRVSATVGARGLVLSTLERCTVDMHRVDPAIVAAMISLEEDRMAQPDWHEAVMGGARSIVQTLAARKHVKRWISRITAPTLLLHGRQDRVVKVRSSRAAADLRPDWDFIEFLDAGHIPMMEIPHDFLDVVNDWLTHAVRSNASQHTNSPRLTA